MTIPRTTARRLTSAFTAAIGVGALALAALTGCASPSRPSAAISHHPVARVTTPAYVQPATPPALLGGNCAQLVPLSEVQAAFSPTVAAAPSGNFVDVSLFGNVPFRQSGGLDCLWQDPGMTYTLEVGIVPNATAAFETENSLLTTIDDASRVSGVTQYGDHSWTQCYNFDDPWYGGCDITIKVGSFWLDVETQNGTLTVPYPAPAQVQALVNDLVAKVRTFAPRRRWVPHTDSLTLPTSCEASVPVATVRTALGHPALAANPGIAQEPSALLSATFDLTGSQHCAWSAGAAGSTGEDPVVDFTVVPGSAWAWPATAPLPAQAAAAGQPAVAALGTVASGGCAPSPDGQRCVLDVLADHTWIEVTDFGPGLSLAGLTTIARSYLATIHFAS